MAQTRIFTIININIDVQSLLIHFFLNCGLRASDGGQNYLTTLITLQNGTKLLFYTLPGAIYMYKSG